MPYERGLYSTEPIKNGTVVMRVHPKLFMGITSAKSTSLLPVIGYIEREGWMTSTPALWLVLHLLQEDAKPASFFRPFLDTLPREYGDEFHNALYYGEEEVEDLQGSVAALALYEAMEHTVSAHETGCRALARLYPKEMHGVATCARDQIQWALAMISSRARWLRRDVPTSQTFVPFYDLANHASEGAEVAIDDQGALVVTAIRDYGAGGELRVQYGPKPNAELLMFYGFVEGDTEAAASAVIKIKQSVLDDVFGKGKKGRTIENLFTQHHCPEQIPQLHITLHRNGLPTTPVLHCLRMLFFTADEASQAAAGTLAMHKWGPEFAARTGLAGYASYSTENLLMAFLNKTLRYHEQLFPSSEAAYVRKNGHLHESFHKLPRTWQNAILLHRTEKAVLARGRAAISEALTLLEKMAALELFQQMQASNQQRLVGATDNAPKGEGTPPTNKDSKADANDPAADTSSCTGSVVGDGMCSMPP
eukprot:jgi/Mesvir1/26772/Mv20547-RA.1